MLELELARLERAIILAENQYQECPDYLQETKKVVIESLKRRKERLTKNKEGL